VKLLASVSAEKNGVLKRLARLPGARGILALSFLLGLAYSFVMPFLSVFGTREVGMSAFGFGAFMTATSLSSVALSTWLARWSDTILSRRKVLLLGGLTGAFGYLGYALCRDVMWLTLFGVVFLGLSSVTFGQVFALARDTLEQGGIEPGLLPLYMNVVRLFFALAWTVGPALGAALVAQSFRTAFLTATGVFLAFTALVALCVPEKPPSEGSKRAASAMPLRAAFRQPALLAHFLAFVLFFACSTMGMMNLPLLLLEELRGGAGAVGVAYALPPFFELPFMVYFGALATRVRHERLVLFAMLLAAVYYAGLSWAARPPHVYVLQVASAAIVAVMSGVAITFFQRFLPQQAGTATNLYSSASRVGSMLGYLTFGAVADGLGHRAVFRLAVGATLLAAGIVYSFRRDRDGVTEAPELPLPPQASAPASEP
jgi:SET family sugar efflux transporter-like MFS transporter